MTPPKEDTMLIVKSYVNITNAEKMMELVRDNIQVPNHAKHKLSQAINRLSWCVKDIMCTLTTPEAKAAFKKEIEDWESLAFEEAKDEMLLLPIEKRSHVAELIRAFRRDEIKSIDQPENN